jgi:coenzyme F420 biosynthesis associated uncharacterized protein
VVNRSAFGRGLLVGLVAGALWTVAKERTREATPRLLDWTLVERVAFLAAGAGEGLHDREREELQRAYRIMLQEVEGPIAEYTGAPLSLDAIAVHVLDRREWIAANLANVQDLLGPLEEVYQRMARLQDEIVPGLRYLGRTAVSGEVGVMLGYLGRRVLGQFDISVLVGEAIPPGRLLFVQPNIQHVERQLGLPAEDFRRWLVLHEATHAHEFENHPWIRRYLSDTVRAYLETVAQDLGRLTGQLKTAKAFLGRVVDQLRQGSSLFEALLTPEQRRLVARLQALMCLLEGYSNHLMNTVGRVMLPHYQLIQTRVEARQRQRSPAEELFLRLTGLQLKLDQYALGERFVRDVAQARGIAFVNLAWQGPEYLPTMDEVREPDRWVRRVAAQTG